MRRPYNAPKPGDVDWGSAGLNRSQLSQISQNLPYFLHCPILGSAFRVPLAPSHPINMALLRDPEVMLLENERQKYCNETHEPTTHQLHRLSASCQLLKEDIHVLHQIKSSSTRQRKITAQINLEKISKLSSSVFTLYSFLVTTTEIGKKSYLELIPKLRSWWETVEHPKRLLEKVQLFCELEGIEYIETGRIEAGTFVL
jgi:hypothetical protein